MIASTTERAKRVGDGLISLTTDEAVFVLSEHTLIFVAALNVCSVHIPRQFDTGHSIDKIASDFLKNGVKNVFIDDEIETVCPRAFFKASVERVRWSSSCNCIPKECFLSSSIRFIENIDNVITIVDSAFKDSLINHFEVPPKVTEIPQGCFKDSSLRTIVTHNNIHTIRGAAFYGTDLLEIDWPSACTSISMNCFSHCKSLSGIRNISSVTRISEGAFVACISMKKFVWPDNCPNIPKRCFSECTGLSQIVLNDNIVSVGRRAFEYIALKDYPLIWPDKCLVIPSKCFFKARLKAVNGLCNITEIEEEAFMDTNMSDCLDLSSSCVFLVGDNAFDGFHGKIIPPYYFPDIV